MGPGSLRALLFAFAVLAAVAGAVLLLARAWNSNSTSTSGQALPHDAPPAAISARILCTLSNKDAAAALVAGADGGASVVVGDTTWWLFGDTLFDAESGKQIEPNSIASSTDLRPDGCPRLDYLDRDGIAVPFIEKDGSLTVWPTGGWASDDTGFDFYTAYVYGSGPYSYSVDDIGVAHFDTMSMTTTVLTRRLWDETSGFASRVLHVQPVEVAADGGLRLILHTESTAKLLARVEPVRIADASAYQYWDGSGWSASPADASPLWTIPAVASDVEKLALFENGAGVAWNEFLQKYVAVINVGYETVGARTADRLEGPWSEPVKWLDCLAFARPRVPTCYSPLQHPSLAAEDGQTLVTTISAIEPYQMEMVEVTLGTAIHEYRLGDGVAYANEDPGDGWEDQGIAFYASSTPGDGFDAIYRWHREDEARYAATAPGDGFEQGAIAFYAPTSSKPDAKPVLIHYRPVYDWSDDTTHVLSPLETGLEQYGYTRGGVMFYAP